ncbi:MAG: BatA and WFA domain-containing protein [Candidatus Riflebacteria bacterium]|nr:BatA and WFA domain-containing protein [Candidatus Riflebacteria bacterium]
MSGLFLNPEGLWGILLLFPVIAIYFIKSRPKRISISSHIIWKLVLSKIKPNSFLDRFQNSIFLLLQLSAIFLAVLAFARPAGPPGKGLTRFVVIDDSASMMAHDLLPNRLEAAKKRAVELLREWNGKIEVFLLTDKIERLCDLSGYDSRIEEIVQKLQPTGYSTPDSHSVLRLLKELESQSPDEIFLLTDTLSITFPGDFSSKTRVSLEIFAKKQENIGIFGDSNSCMFDKNMGFSCEVAIYSCFSKESEVEISVEKDGKKYFPTKIRLYPFEKKRQRFEELPAPPLVIRLVCSKDANLSVGDDQWFVSSPSNRPLVFLSGFESSDINKLQRSFSEINFKEFTGNGKELGDASAILISGKPTFDVSSFSFACFSPGSEPFGNAGIYFSNSAHRLIKLINTDDLASGTAFPKALPGCPVIESTKGTLLSEENKNIAGVDKTQIWLAFDSRIFFNSENILFPIFLYNILNYLLKNDFPKYFYQFGDLELKRLGLAEIPSIPGFYPLKDAKVAINIQSSREFSIAPGKESKFEPVNSGEKFRKQEENSPWKAFLTIACILILGEWVLFIRRC